MIFIKMASKCVVSKKLFPLSDSSTLYGVCHSLKAANTITKCSKCYKFFISPSNPMS